MFIKVFFLLSAMLTVFSSLGIVITKNIMHSCIYLLSTLLGVAGLYLAIGADFVATTQVMVYVGGVVILMLFAVMLTGGKDFISKAQALLGLAATMGNKWTYFIGIFTGLVFLLVSGKLAKKFIAGTTIQGEKPFVSTLEELGRLLVTDHLLAFEISSVLLVGALVGAAIIARPSKDSKKVQS